MNKEDRWVLLYHCVLIFISGALFGAGGILILIGTGVIEIIKRS